MTNPIYLPPHEVNEVLELAQRHDQDLFERLREKSERDEQEITYGLLADLAQDEELEVDTNPVVSVGDDGAWVLCWNWFSKDEIEDDE